MQEMRTKIVLLGTSLLIACSVAQAQTGGGFYAGLGMGNANARFTTSDFTFGQAGVTESQDNTNTGYKFFGGYHFSRYLGTELSYTDFGNFFYKYNGSAVGLGSERLEYAASSWAISAIGTFPLTGGFSVLARLGLTSNATERSAAQGDATVPVPPSSRHRKAGGLLGIGGQFDFTRVVGVRLEYENYGKFGRERASPLDDQPGRASIRMLSVSLIANF
jgi:opacity protein-like surface antigen